MQISAPIALPCTTAFGVRCFYTALRRCDSRARTKAANNRRTPKAPWARSALWSAVFLYRLAAMRFPGAHEGGE